MENIQQFNRRFDEIIDLSDNLAENREKIINIFRSLTPEEKEKLLNKIRLETERLKSQTKSNLLTLMGSILAQSEKIPSIEVLNNNIASFISELKKGTTVPSISYNYLDSIDFTKLEETLRVAYSSQLTDAQKTPNFLQKREELLSLVQELIKTYEDKRKTDVDFEPHEGFERFKTDLSKITDIELRTGLSFVESLDKMNFGELLAVYEKYKDDDSKRMVIVHKIVKKFVTDKGHHLGYDNSGKIVIKKDSLENNTFPQAVDDESKQIIEKISQKDLKTIVVEKAIVASGLDLENTTNYEKTIGALLLKYKVVDGSSNQFVYLDIFDETRKNDLLTALNLKIGELSKENKVDMQGIQSLEFIVDYINNKKDYSVKIVKQAEAFAKVRAAGYDPSSKEGLDKIKQAFKNGEGMKTILGDFMEKAGGGGMLFLMISIIVGLFSSKHRKFTWGLLGALTLGPAFESMAHDYIGYGKDGNYEGKQETSSWTGKVEVKPKGLTEEQETAYGILYQKNAQKQEKQRIFNQDFAQIYAQLATNQNLAKMKVSDLKTGLKAGTDLETILGGDDKVPSAYRPGILKSDTETIIDNRVISQTAVKRFLTLLVDNAEDADATVGDIFVEGQKESHQYIKTDIAGYKQANEKIEEAISLLAIGTPIQVEVIRIIGRTEETLPRIGNAFSDYVKLQNFESMLEQLKNLKSENCSGNTNSKDCQALDTLIEEYTKLNDYLHFTYSAKAIADERFFGTEGWAKNLAGATIAGLNYVYDWMKDQSASGTISSLDWSKDAPIELIDKTIEKGKKLAGETRFTPEQKQEIEKHIVMLYDKKIKILNEQNNSTEAEKVAQEKLLALPALALEAIAFDRINDLENVSGDDIDKYHEALNPVVGDIEKLKKYKEALKKESNKTPAQNDALNKINEALKKYDTFKNNFAEAVKRNKKSIADLETEIGNIQVSGNTTVYQALDSLKKAREKYDKLKENITSSSAKDTNTIDAVQSLIKKIDGNKLEIKEGNSEVINLDEELKKLEKALAEKEKELLKEIKFEVPQNIDWSDENAVKDFIKTISKKRELADLLESEGSGNVLEARFKSFVEEVQQNIVSALDKLNIVNNQDWENVTRIKTNYDLIVSEFKSWKDKLKGFVFDDSVEEKLKKKHQERYTERLKQMTVREVLDSNDSEVLSAFKSIFTDSNNDGIWEFKDDINITVDSNNVTIESLTALLLSSPNNKLQEIGNTIDKAIKTDNSFLQWLLGVKYDVSSLLIK